MARWSEGDTAMYRRLDAKWVPYRIVEEVLPAYKTDEYGHYFIIEYADGALANVREFDLRPKTALDAMREAVHGR